MANAADRPRGARGELFEVPAALAGAPLDRGLRSLLGNPSWNQVRRLITTGKVRVDGQVVLEPTLRLAARQELAIVHSAPRPGVERQPRIVIEYVDAQVVVVEKPAGLSTVPYDESEPDALDLATARVLKNREGQHRSPLGIVHRLDKDTTGLVVFARTLPAKRALKNQFRFHHVRRRYWAIANGHVEPGALSSRLVPDRGDGLRGSTENPRLGREATTHVRVLERLPSATLLECRLETGRTHQIRIHLAEAGHPLLGERVYVRGHAGPLLVAPRVMLHAFELGFDHPTTGEPLDFQSAMPADMLEVLESLRARSLPASAARGAGPRALRGRRGARRT